MDSGKNISWENAIEEEIEKCIHKKMRVCPEREKETICAES